MYQIIIQTSFIAQHRWVQAPNNVDFLRNYHRHKFFIKMWIEVDHSDRDKEFFTVKAELDKFLKKNYEGRKFEFSCETLAEILAVLFNADQVEVYEDNECGGKFINHPKDED